MKKWLKRISFSIWVVLTVYLVICVAILGGQNDKYSQEGYHIPASVQGTISQNPTLVTDAQTLGINYSEINLVFVATPLASDVASQAEVISVFIPPNTIQIKTDLSKPIELQSV